MDSRASSRALHIKVVALRLLLTFPPLHTATVLHGQFGRLHDGPVEGWSKKATSQSHACSLWFRAQIALESGAQLTVAVIVYRVLRAGREARAVIVRLGAPPLAAPRVLPSVMLEGKGVSLALPKADLCH